MGLLITIEGGEFVGKSAVGVPGLQWVLQDAGLDVKSSREPGGSPEAEALRKQIFSSAKTGGSPDELAILFNKARRIHLEQVIKPFLGEHKEKDTIMVLDRYLDSTRVYQGLEGKLPLERIYELEAEFIDNYFPDLTFILFFPPKHFKDLLRIRRTIASETETNGRSDTTWDSSDETDQQRRQEYYLSIEKLAKERGEKRQFHSIDASQSPIQVVTQMVSFTKPFLPHKTIKSVNLALQRLKTSPFILFQERQWKKQQQLLQQI